ncbi:MAG: LptE family protein [Kiritimatiellae bacterium]|nr:LptE family protein [Kiritimatiellia bacterium]
MNIRHHRLAALPLLAALLAVAGCASYRVGTTLPPGLRTISVDTFLNRTGEPLIETEVTRATLQELQREGQLELVGKDDAAIRLVGTVVSYRLEPMRYERDRPRTVREYRVVIRAAIKATQRAGNKTIVDTVVQGDATLPAGGDLISARRSAMPEAARQLAHEIVNAVVSAW